MSIVQFNNKTNLPLLVEYWEYDKNIAPSEKIKCNLNYKIIKPFKKYRLFSLTGEWYVSSLFLKDDYKNNNIWKDNQLPNEMICTFQNKPYSSNNSHVIMTSTNFDVKYEKEIITIIKN
jgi:hypothetical protein